MIIWLKELLMQILIWLLGFIDSVFEVFRAVAGLDTVTTTNGEQSISEYFLGLDGVQWAFWVVFIAALGICAVCTVVAIVKNVVNAKGGEPKSHVKTVGQSLSTVVISLFMAMFLVVGMTCVDKLLGAVDKSINYGEQTVMSHEIINIAASDGYIFDRENIQGLNKADENGNVTYVSYLYNFALDGNKPKTYPDHPNCIVYLKSDGSEYDFSDIYSVQSDSGGNPVLDSNGNTVYDLELSKLTARRSQGGWNLKTSTLGYMTSGDESAAFYSKNDLPKDINDATVKKLLGDDHWVIVPVPVSWKRDGMLEPDSFNFLIAYICAIVLMIALISSTFGLVKRLFDIVLLFIALPGIAATIPLDDGAKFKLWRETVISKVFLAFGTVFAVNVFTIVAPQIWGIGLAGTGSFTNSVLKLVLICGGALTISGGQLLFARLLGTSAEESREMGQSARTLMGGVGAAWGAAKVGGRALFGTKDANGQRRGGLVKGAASVAGTVGGGAVNTVGGLIGGQAYRDSKFGKGVNKTKEALQGFGRSAGWFSGGTADNPNLGYGITKGAGAVGGAVRNSGVARSTGLNNGIVGAVRKPGENRRAAARENAQNMLTQSSEAINNAYSAAAAASSAQSKSLPHDDFGREVMAGFEGGAPSALPAPVEPSAQSAAQKAAGKKE